MFIQDTVALLFLYTLFANLRIEIIRQMFLLLSSYIDTCESNWSKVVKRDCITDGESWKVIWNLSLRPSGVAILICLTRLCFFLTFLHFESNFV